VIDPPDTSTYCGFHWIVRQCSAGLDALAATSIDIRQKRVHAYKRWLGSQRVLASVFGVSLSCIAPVLRCSRTTSV
jgi:hypothetical protein